MCKVKIEDISITDMAEFSYDKGLSLPGKLIDELKYGKKKLLNKEKILYIQEEYVAYADIKIKLINRRRDSVDIEFANIRRKEYYDEPLSDKDKKDLEKITGGIKEIQAKAEYIKKCGGDIHKYSFTGKFI